MLGFEEELKRSCEEMESYLIRRIPEDSLKAIQERDGKMQHSSYSHKKS